MSLMGDDRLIPTLSTGRFAKYLALHQGDQKLAIAHYRWNAELSSALFADLGVVEVAMRNRMAEELAGIYGSDWFAKGELFDDATRGKIAAAWADNRIGGLPPAVHQGKLIASLTFGFWNALLSRGNHAKDAPPFDRKLSYDELLWKPALHKAFPGSTGSRSDVHDVVTMVRHVRNRVAHHEAIIWGIPLAGQTDKNTGKTRRLSVSQGHAKVVELARFIDLDLNAWITANSTLPSLVAAVPGGVVSGLSL